MERQMVPFLRAIVRTTVLSGVFEWRGWIRWFSIERSSAVARHLLGSAVDWSIVSGFLMRRTSSR